MDSPKKDRRLHAITTNWSNNSHTSINTTSDTATFHSANDLQKHRNSQNMELQSLKTHFPFTEPHTLISPTTNGPRKDSIPEVPSLVNSTSSSRRTSTSTSTSRRTSPSKSKRRTYQGTTTTNTYNIRPVTKRATRSTPQTLSSFSCQRPHLNARHTIPYLPSTPPQQTANQFFHFPSLPTPDSSPNSKAIPQPPPTMQYWTSDNTRRLEYAAIDAASRGVRGFLNKLIPECMLPKDMRRTRFCEGDEDSDAGSVRRYRLDLPGEDEAKNTDGKRSGVFRRWSGGFRSSTA